MKIEIQQIGQFYSQNVPYDQIKNINTPTLCFVHIYEIYSRFKIKSEFREVS